MAGSTSKSVPRALLLAAAGLLSTEASATSFSLKGDSKRGPVDCSADTVSVDYQNHHVVLSGNVKIVQGDVSVAADKAEATGLDAQDSHWVFTGHVHVRAEGQGELASDRATVQFSRGNVAHVVVTGQPAEFEQAQEKAGERARGHAGSIDYDVGAGLVQLNGDAWLSDGHNDINYPQITYNVRQKSLQAEGGRGHSTVVPRPGRDSGQNGNKEERDK